MGKNPEHPSIDELLGQAEVRLGALPGKITKFKEEHERKTREAIERGNKDQLTGLYNRHGLKELFERVVKEAPPPGTPEKRKAENKEIVVLALDIDHFKQVNDEYGHDIGNQILVQAAAFLSGIIRSGDIAGRPGGEEFVVVFNRTEVDKIVEKLTHEQLTKPERDAEPGRPPRQNPFPQLYFTAKFVFEGRPVELPITFSGGISTFRQGQDRGLYDFGDQGRKGERDDQYTYGRADKLCLRAKGEGRNRILLDPELEFTA